MLSGIPDTTRLCLSAHHDREGLPFLVLGRVGDLNHERDVLRPHVAGLSPEDVSEGHLECERKRPRAKMQGGKGQHCDVRALGEDAERADLVSRAVRRLTLVDVRAALSLGDREEVYIHQGTTQLFS